MTRRPIRSPRLRSGCKISAIRAAVGSRSQVRAATARIGPAAPSNAPPNCVSTVSISFMARPETNSRHATAFFARNVSCCGSLADRVRQPNRWGGTPCRRSSADQVCGSFCVLRLFMGKWTWSTSRVVCTAVIRAGSLICAELSGPRQSTSRMTEATSVALSPARRPSAVSR